MYTAEDGAIQPNKQRPQEMAGMPLGPPLQSKHTERQRAVVEAFKHAWRAYKAYAWGKDELKPISKDSNEWFNLGLTLVDALDTMWVMGLTEEFNEAREWVAKEMVVAQDKDVNLFETTIRVMGGLLSTYHLTQDELFLERAVSLLHVDNCLLSVGLCVHPLSLLRPISMCVLCCLYMMLVDDADKRLLVFTV